MKLLYQVAGQDREYSITQAQVHIGRDPACEIHIDDPAVSRRHVTLTWENGQLTAVDEQSGNGMFVNDVRLEKAVLQPGDVLRAGPYGLTLVADRDQDQVATAEATMHDAEFGLSAALPHAASPVAQAAVPNGFAGGVATPAAAVASAAPAPPTGAPTPQTPGRVLGVLTVVGGMARRSYNLVAGARITLGSDPDNVAVLQGKGVSGHHAEVVPRGRGWVVRDLKSRNGTWVGGKKVEEHELKHNDAVHFGSVVLEFMDPSAASSAPAAGSGRPRAAQRRRRLLVGSGVGGAALILALLTWGFSGPEQPVVPANSMNLTSEGAPTKAEVERRIRLQTGQTLQAYQEALKRRFLDPTLNGKVSDLLSELLGAMPPSNQDRRVLGTLSSILIEAQRRQPSFQGIDWRELESRAQEARVHPLTGSIGRELQAWAKAERDNQSFLSDARDKYRARRPEEAFTLLKRVESSSVYQRESTRLLLEIKDQLIERTVAQAKSSIDAGDFETALVGIDEILTLFETRYPDAILTLSPFRKEAESSIRYQKVLAEVRLLMERKSWEEAEAAIAGLDYGTPPVIRLEADRLMERIRVKKIAEAAREQYNRGDGNAALTLLQTEVSPELLAMRARISAVVNAFRSAQQAMASRQVEQAKKHLGRVVGLEANPNNRYHKEAKRLLGDRTSQDLIRADAAAEAGLEAERREDLSTARDQYEEALQLNPSQKQANAAIRVFLRQAQIDYNLDNLAYQRREMSRETLLERWRNKLSFLRLADGAVYEMYRDGLARLEAANE